MSRFTIFTVLLGLCLCSPAFSQDEERTIELFAAYQSGYLQVVAVSCFQLYSTSGIIATDYLNGYIDGGTAQDAMAQNRLLLSVCTTTLAQIAERTPLQDELALAEFRRLNSLLLALKEFMDAADEFFINPTPESADRAESAQTALDLAMQEYAGPVPE